MPEGILDYEDWTARDVVSNIIDMHGVMLRPLGRNRLSPDGGERS